MAATITTVVDPDTTEEPFLVTGRELAVLAVVTTLVLGALLLLFLTSGNLVSELFGSS